jgi:hypothetical protein
MITVLGGRHNRPMSGKVTSQFVGDQRPGFSSSAFEETPEKASHGFLVTAALHKKNHILTFHFSLFLTSRPF